MGPKLHRGFSLALVLAVVVLLGVSLFAFANNLQQGHKDRIAPLAQLINGNTLNKTDEDALLTEQRHPSLVFAAEHLTLASKQLQGVLRFELPTGVQDELVDTNTGKKVFDCPANSACTVKPQYANSQIQVQLVTASSEAGGEFEFQKNVPLSAISNSILDRVVMPVNVPVTGFPDLYPQDHYFFDVLMSFTLPANIDRKVNGKAPTGADKDFYAFDPGNVTEAMDTKVSALTDNKGTPQDGEFHVSLQRKTLTAWYVYSVATIPLIFGFLFLHLLFFSRHFQHKVFEEFTEALIVAILAVLPLRAVLVPVELEGLTRVDLVLGLGLVLIVAVAVGKYASEIWSAADIQSKAHPATAEAHPPAESHLPAPAE